MLTSKSLAAARSVRDRWTNSCNTGEYLTVNILSNLSRLEKGRSTAITGYSDDAPLQQLEAFRGSAQQRGRLHEPVN
jgi:hypothetical protein